MERQENEIVMLSTLRRFYLTDKRQHRASLQDLGVALLEEDHPPVTHLLFTGKDKQQSMLSWESVESIDWQRREIKVADLSAAEAIESEEPKGVVLLQRDILDALIIDLQNRRLTRANDLALEEADGRLLLRAADTGAMSIIRRLTRGRYGPVHKHTLYDWKYVEFLRGDPQAVKNGEGYNLHITRLPHGEIARLTDPLPYLHAAELLTLLPDPKAADTLEAMSPERQLQVFEELDEEQALRLLDIMAPEVAADLVGRLQTDTMQHYLESLSEKQSERIIDLLRYPEDSVGGVMTNDVVYAPVNLTVAEARQHLRERLKEPDFIFSIYVVDDETTRHLRGVVSVRCLLTCDDDKTLEEVMDPYIVAFQPLEPAREAAYRLINSDLAAMPVVGKRGQLLGALTVDAAVAQVAPESWRSQAPKVFS